MTDILRFPPLPALPEPPQVPLDPRQQKFYRVIGGLKQQLLQQDEGSIATVNTVGGYRASAVDVGHLQDLIEDGLRLFDMDVVRDRWDVDLFSWCARVLTTWIQRCKHVKLDLCEECIHVHLETQDDRGYYFYEFDVLAGRKR